MRSHVIAIVATLVVLVPIAPAQLTTNGNVTATLVAGNLQAFGDAMAVDASDNAYIAQSSLANTFITRVTPAGTVTVDHAPGAPPVQAMAYNPTDGMVYFIPVPNALPVLATPVWRIDPAGGATQVFIAGVVATSFTIDDAGAFYFGGQGGAGPGVYAVFNLPVFPPGPLPATFVSPVPLGNAQFLQSLPGGDLLVSDGVTVDRIIPGALAPVPYYTHTPSTLAAQVTLHGLARMPFNELGAGAAMAYSEYTASCFCGQGLVIPGDLTTGGTAPAIVTDPFITNGIIFTGGIRNIASGKDQDLWFYTHNTSAGGAPAALYRISWIPAAGVPGTLSVPTAPGQVTFDLEGATAGTPVLVNLRLGAVAAPPTFFPPYGCLELNPFSPFVFPIVDGVGLIPPADPTAVIPGSLLFSRTFPVPPSVPPGLAFMAQGLVADAGAPNGVYFKSNVVAAVTP